jgi:hypothetical protein
MADKNEIPVIQSIDTAAQAAQQASVPPANGHVAPGFLSFKRGQQYYTNAGRKVIDCVVGFFAPTALYMLLLPLNMLAAISAVFSIVWLLLLFVAYILAIVLCFVYGRRFFAIGLLVALLIPLLLFGACLLLLSGLGVL